MKNTAKLMKNTLLLSAGSILMRSIGLFFQSYLALRAGAQMLGVYGLISSVYTVFATISISGVRFSVTRLTAEENALGNEKPRHLLNCALFYTLCFSLFSSVFMLFFADFIATMWIGTRIAKIPIRIMALSLPFVGVGAAFEGYFTGKQKVLRMILIQLSDQLMRIGITVLLFSSAVKISLNPCIVLAVGVFAGEVFYALCLIFAYIFERCKKKKRAASPISRSNWIQTQQTELATNGEEKKTAFIQKGTFSRLVKISLPLAVSAYMRTGLSSLGHVIIPYGLRRSGLASAHAFSLYGIVGQMALPVVMFPSAILSSLGEVLIPRLTRAEVCGAKIGISYIVNRALRIALLFGGGCFGVMFFFANDISMLVYKSDIATHYIKILAPVIPIIYCDCVTDGCLKGLGQQLHSMIYNILEALLNVLMLLLLLPRFAITGFIITLYVKEIFNAFLSLRRLSKVTAVEFEASFIITAVLSIILGKIITDIINVGNALGVLSYIIVYVTLLYICGKTPREDLKWMLSVAKDF